MSRSLIPLAAPADRQRRTSRARTRRAEDPEPTEATPQVVVWQADGRPLSDVGYAERIVSRLRPMGWSVEVVDYRTGTLTEVQLAAPVHILSGGETSAFAGDEVTERALGELTGLARRAWSDDLTLIGICLGAQLLSPGHRP